MHDSYGRDSSEVPPSVREYASRIRLSKDGTKYVYSLDEDGDNKHKPQPAIEVANKQLKEILRFKKEQVLNEKVLEKGSTTNISGIFLRVGQILLKKSKATLSRIVFRDDKGKPTTIAVVCNKPEDIVKLEKFVEKLENGS